MNGGFFVFYWHGDIFFLWDLHYKQETQVLELPVLLNCQSADMVTLNLNFETIWEPAILKHWEYQLALFETLSLFNSKFWLCWELFVRALDFEFQIVINCTGLNFISSSKLLQTPPRGFGIYNRDFYFTFYFPASCMTVTIWAVAFSWELSLTLTFR